MTEDLNLLLSSDIDRNIGILNFIYCLQLQKNALLFLIFKKMPFLLQISNPILIWAPYGIHLIEIDPI
jgi:hypothetical protein